MRAYSSESFSTIVSMSLSDFCSMASSPCFSNRSLIAASLVASLIAALIFSTIGRWVSFGTARPCQGTILFAPKPASVMVGTSGNSDDQSLPMTASAFSFFTFTRTTDRPITATANWMRSAIKSIKNGGCPAYVMVVSWMSLPCMNRTALRCVDEPIPALPKFSAPGDFLARSMNSLTVFAGEPGLAISAMGAQAVIPTVVKLFSLQHSPNRSAGLQVSLAP